MGKRFKRLLDMLRLSNGFTLVQLLITCSIVILLFIITIHSYRGISGSVRYLTTLQTLQLEANSFFRFVEKETSNAARYYIAERRFYYYDQMDRYDYQQSGGTIVRQKNNTGYVTVCYYVKQLYLEHTSKGMYIMLVLEKDGIQWKANMQLTTHL